MNPFAGQRCSSLVLLLNRWYRFLYGFSIRFYNIQTAERLPKLNIYDYVYPNNSKILNCASLQEKKISKKLAQHTFASFFSIFFLALYKYIYMISFYFESMEIDLVFLFGFVYMRAYT